MAKDTESIEALLGAARSGDADAIDTLLARQRAGLRRMIEARMQCGLVRRFDASDVVQEALLVAARRFPEFLRDPKLPFLAWLRRIARDRLGDEVRRHAGAERRELGREQAPPVEPFGTASSLDLMMQLVAPGNSPAESLLRRELLARFRSTLARLSEEDQEILLLRHGEQLGNREAAELLGLGEAAAGMRYLRALRRLRDALGDEDASTRGRPDA